VDDEFVPTLKFNCWQEEISKDFNDSTSLFLMKVQCNKSAGKTLLKIFEYPGNSQIFQVIGVAKDFNLQHYTA
jgi:hypothetical protein